MIASETHLSNRPAEEYLFAVIGSPARPATRRTEPRSGCGRPPNTSARPTAAPARSSAAATTAAPTSRSGRPLANGCDQVVWLDARERRYVEEVGGSNLFFVEG